MFWIYTSKNYIEDQDTVWKEPGVKIERLKKKFKDEFDKNEELKMKLKNDSASKYFNLKKLR